MITSTKIIRPWNNSLLSTEGFYDKNQNDSAEQSDQEAVQVESADTALAKKTHKPAAEKSPDYANDNIQNNSLLVIGSHYHRSDPTDQAAKNNPKNEPHIIYCINI